MMFDAGEVTKYCESEDIKFIRLAFCDVFGRQKNISVMPSELKRAFGYGIAFDGSAVKGFGDIANSDLFLRPDPATLTVLPWRPEQQRVARMYCSVHYPDGEIHGCDTRNILKNAVRAAKEAGEGFSFGREHEFTVFDTEKGGFPADYGECMDLSPLDSCENFRRELCLTMEKMSIITESSHHGSTAGQNRFTFAPVDTLRAADDMLTFLTAARAVAESFGLKTDILDSRFNVTFGEISRRAAEGVEKRITEIKPFLLPKGSRKSVSLRTGNADGCRAVLELPCASVNPYIVLALLIYAGIEGTESADLAERHLPEAIIEMYS